MNIETITDARGPAHSPGIKRPPNVKALTAVRFFAALHVALYHLVRPVEQWGIFSGAIGCGYIGISFFFVLSGFILTYSHAHEYEAGRGSPIKFYIARIARVYPVYLLTLLVAAYLNRADLFNKHVYAFVASMFLVQAWSTRLVNYFNLPAWTLSVEAFFYFLLPLVLMRLRPSTSRKALLSATGFWLMAMAVPVFCCFRYPAVSLHEVAAPGPGGPFTFNVARLPIFHVPEFLSGVALGWFFVRFKPSQRVLAILVWSGIALMAVALFFADYLPYLPLHNGLLLPLYGMVLIGLCGDNLPARLLSNPVLVLLGEASFALYLIHFMYNDFTGFWYGAARDLREAFFKLAVLLPLSVLLHLYVERPGRRVILDWWRKRHPDQLAVAAG